ncbi:5'/3'-nucleotidase SurE [Archangium sp. Cb G35]|uniref:5'/3'-nucleotidase SurE n=1 Tax=Archangium sp. Cb G35 TaxID=1920190 RepID=UPI0009F8F565|nr:5'/3'-nucleotidase SurE [Archangium sp. Cb G35]
MRATRPLGLFLLASFIGAGTEAHASPESSSPATERPLRILLTSDDGINGSGLRLLRDTLCAAGHQVTVVAPATDRSGSSAALSLNVYLRATRSEFSCGGTTRESWAVTGMPSDSVLFGLSAVLGDVPPDLVVSGMNSGQNVGRAVNHSGTVGSAVTAAEEGVPSMAVSISIHPQDASTGFSQTGAAAPHAAAFVKDLIAQLRDTARPGEPLLPDRVALNVNYPVVLDAEGKFDPALVQSPRVTSVGHGEVVRARYYPVDANGIYLAAGHICGLDIQCAPETERDADTTALEQGAISITPLSVDGSARPGQGWLKSRLRRP